MGAGGDLRQGAASRRKLRVRVRPCCVATLSGWNCTPARWHSEAGVSEAGVSGRGSEESRPPQSAHQSGAARCQGPRGVRTK
eukprot:3105989-Pyramimonas_sp.AAC.1